MEVNENANVNTGVGVDINEPTPNVVENKEPIVELPTEPKEEKVTADDILKLKEEYESTKRNELEEISKTYEEQMAELKNQLEEIKLANMIKSRILRQK